MTKVRHRIQNAISPDCSKNRLHKKIKPAVQIERQDAFLLESDEDLGSLESRMRRKPRLLLDDEDESFSIKCTVEEKVESAISVKKQIAMAAIALAVIFIALTLLTCVEHKELSRETLRAIGDTSDALPTYLPVVKSSCKKRFFTLFHFMF